MFSAEAAKFQTTEFLRRCHVRALDLVHNDFEEAAVTGYHEAAKVEMQQLAASGSKKVDTRTPTKIFFLSEYVDVYPTSLHDVKNWILEGVATTEAISGKQVTRTPWEPIRFGEEALTGIGETVQVPERLLARGKMPAPSF